MKFEVLKGSHMKRNIIVGILVVAIISACVLTFTRAKYRITQSIQIVNGQINFKPYDFKTVAIYVEDTSGEFIDQDEVPLSGYDLNLEKSYCTSNDELDTSIEISYNIGTITIDNISKKTKCYLYFTLQEEASNLGNRILSNNGGKDAIESKSSPDFSKISPSFIKAEDQGIDGQGIYSSDAALITYVAYSDSYSFDENTGLYSLNNSNISLYQEIYEELIGKYISTPYWEGDASVPTSNLEYIYKVTDAESSLIYLQTLRKNLIQDLNDKGMYASTDDYGTSYYFRGAVDNNWVYFAGFYWRIIRINGDGSIRMIYAGDRANITPTNGPINYLSINTGLNSTASYPYTVNNGQAEYVGYMYQLGNSHGIQYNSTIKTVIDNWYQTNLSSYQSYLADIGFCNDRTGYTDVSGTQTIEAIGSNSVIFGPMIRNFVNRTPTLKCPNKEDNFTVDDTSKGNGALSYPIGLITIDESVYAGLVYNVYNTYNFLNVGANYWTMSPVRSQAEETYGLRVWMVGQNGSITDNHVYNSSGIIRPVINLNSSVNAIGTGSASDPYIII